MMQIDSPGVVVTFYSYKGGTGRSMALANIAYLLATRQTALGGKRVLAIDWDLEAPGLHRYFQPYLKSRAARHGLIDLIEEVRASSATLSSGSLDKEERTQRLVDGIELSRYIVDTACPSLSFIQAGIFENSSYAERVNTFPWQSFFRETPSFYRRFAERLGREYSWILIDSRTGLTDISGVCTMLMPEKLVVVFTPNRQSLTGIVDLVRRATKYRRESEDLRPLVVYPLPSRIETSVQPIAQRWRFGDPARDIEGWQGQFDAVFREVYDLEKEFTLEHYFDEVQLQHVAPYAYGEPLPVIDERSSDRLTLTKSYETFREYLTLDTPWSEVMETTTDTNEVRKQIDRLNDAVRAQSMRQMWLVWLARHPKSIAAMFLVLALVASMTVLLSDRFSARDESLRLVSSALRDAQQNPNGLTVLLLEQALTNLRGNDRDLAVRELQKRLLQLPQHLMRIPTTQDAISLTFSPDGRRLLVLSRNFLSVRNVGNGSPLVHMKSDAEFLAGAFSDDGTLVIIRDSPLVVELWSADGIARRLISPLPGKLINLRWDGRYVAVRDTEAVSVLRVDPDASQLIPVLKESILGAPAFEPNVVFGGDLVTLWRPEALLIGNVRSGTWEHGIPFVGGPQQYYAFTESGYVAIAEDDSLTISPIGRARPQGMLRMTGIKLRATALSFEPGTTRLAALLESGNIDVGDAKAFYERRVTLPRTRTDAPSFLFWSPGYIVAGTGSWINFYNTQNLSALPRVFEAPSIGNFAIRGNVMAVQVSQAVVLLNLAPNDGAIAAMSDAARRQIVCSRGRDLSPEEWTAYVGNRKYTPLCGSGRAAEQVNSSPNHQPMP